VVVEAGILEGSGRMNIFYLASVNRLGQTQKGKLVSQITAIKIATNGLEIQDYFSIDKHPEMKTISAIRSYAGQSKQDFVFIAGEQSILVLKLTKSLTFVEFHKFKSLLSGSIIDIDLLYLGMFAVCPTDRLVAVVNIPNNFTKKKEIDFTDYVIDKILLKRDRSIDSRRTDEEDGDQL